MAWNERGKMIKTKFIGTKDQEITIESSYEKYNQAREAEKWVKILITGIPSGVFVEVERAIKAYRKSKTKLFPSEFMKQYFDKRILEVPDDY